MGVCLDLMAYTVMFHDIQRVFNHFDTNTLLYDPANPCYLCCGLCIGDWSCLGGHDWICCFPRFHTLHLCACAPLQDKQSDRHIQLCPPNEYLKYWHCRCGVLGVNPAKHLVLDDVMWYYIFALKFQMSACDGRDGTFISSNTSTVYWCIASKLKAPRNFYWMSNMFLWVEIFLFFVCYHVVPKRHSQLDYELNGL